MAEEWTSAGVEATPYPCYQPQSSRLFSPFFWSTVCVAAWVILVSFNFFIGVMIGDQLMNETHPTCEPNLSKFWFPRKCSGNCHILRHSSVLLEYK